MKKEFKYTINQGLPGGPNELKKFIKGSISVTGYKSDSPDVNNDFNIIPSNNITMQGVNFPVLGIDNLGNKQMMMPGGEYTFPGSMVYEKPMMKKGGVFLGKTIKCSNCGHSYKAADGGKDPLTCHKCGSIIKMQMGGTTEPFNYNNELPEMGKGGLTQWFDEKWVDVKTGKTCGRSGKDKNSRPYPACRPSKRVNETTPKTASELSSSEKAKFKREKTSSQRISYNHKKEEGGETGWLDQYQVGGHVIAPNETFYGIANKYGFNKEELINANPGLDIDKIRPGQKINLPTIERMEEVNISSANKKEPTGWYDYINPFNWGAPNYDDAGTFKQAFRKARTEDQNDFMYYGDRYSSDLAQLPENKKEVVKDIVEPILKAKSITKDRTENTTDINIEGLKKGISQAESVGGKLMINPESTATGLYGQRYSELIEAGLYPKGDKERRDFAKDLEAQNKIFDIRLKKGITSNTGLIEDAQELYNEYAPQIKDFNYSKEDLVALSNFLGRQGTRNYLGSHIRDKKPLAKALPAIYGSGAGQNNKTPEQYLEITRKFYKRGGQIKWLDNYK